jgi:hypothetical protein
MSISEKDIKKLWGLAAGRCSYPGCNECCIKLLRQGATVIGEMAHVIARSPGGPRGIDVGGQDTYENLILLCPTHHREIDKSPIEAFPAEYLLDWKCKHETNVAEALTGLNLESSKKIGVYIRRLLTENRKVWETYGPESKEAQSNPVSNLAELWDLRKLETIIPNNRRIVDTIRKNKHQFDNDGYETACTFIEHAIGFERNCYDRTEGVPQFPEQFEKMINSYAESQ